MNAPFTRHGRGSHDTYICRLRAFFDENPDEELRMDDVMTKFGVTRNTARSMLRRLVYNGMLISSGTRPAVYRRKE